MLEVIEDFKQYYYEVHVDLDYTMLFLVFPGKIPTIVERGFF